MYNENRNKLIKHLKIRGTLYDINSKDRLAQERTRLLLENETYLYYLYCDTKILHEARNKIDEKTRYKNIIESHLGKKEKQKEIRKLEEDLFNEKKRIILERYGLKED